MGDLIDCKRCGEPHPRCAGHNKAGKPCGMYPRAGATVCKRHGGHAPQVKAAAERRRQAAEAAASVATYGLPIDIDPASALIEELHRTAGAVFWLGQLVRQIPQDELTWGVVEETEGPMPGGGYGTQTKRKAVPPVIVQLYQQERKHLVEVSKVALGADASGRVAAVFEQIGNTYVGLIERVLDRLDLTAEQRAAIPGVLVEELQALPGGTP